MEEKHEKQSKKRIEAFEQWMLSHPWGFWGVVFLVLLLLLILYWAIWADVSPQWTGFGAYDEEVNGPRAKTLWDWMDLLLIPIVLAIAGYWFNHTQKQFELAASKRERATEREIAQDKSRQQMLENYFARMKELLLDRKLGNRLEPSVELLARILTLNVLRGITALNRG